MPEISRFYGIKIFMHITEHPPPHFHAQYGDQWAAVNIETLEVIGGKLSHRALRLVREWAAIHRKELSDNWNSARERIPFSKIQPLE